MIHAVVQNEGSPDQQQVKALDALKMAPSIAKIFPDADEIQYLLNNIIFCAQNLDEKTAEYLFNLYFIHQLVHLADEQFMEKVTIRHVLTF